MRQIDEVHDAEHQRQPRRQQKQQQAELQPVQELFDDKQHSLSNRPPFVGLVDLSTLSSTKG